MTARPEWTLEVDGPEAAFGTENGDFDTDKIVSKHEGLSDNVEYAKVSDNASTTDLGRHRTVKGLVNGQVSWTSSLRGQGGSGAGDTTQASETDIGRYFAGCLGAAQTRSTGSQTTATTHTTTSVVEDVGGAHGANQLAIFEVGLDYYVRPIWSYSTDTMTLGMALPSAPGSGGGEYVYGMENIAWADDPAYSLQLRKKGEDTYQHRAFQGCCGTFELPQTPEGEIQKVNYTFNPTTMDRLSDTSGFSQVDPSAVRPTVVAGGEFIIGKSASGAAYQAIDYVRGQISMPNGYTRIPAPNNTGDALGFNSSFGWFREKPGSDSSLLELTLLVSHDDTPPAACDASTWEEMADDQGTNDILQVMLAYGQRSPGSICAFWARNLILTGWSMTDVDGLAAQQLTFHVETGYDAAPLVIATG